MDSLTYLSLYSGGGGLDLGFKLAVPGARAVGYLERDAAAIALLVDHMQAKQLDDAPLWSDSGTFDGKPWRGKVDWVIGGFPCQPWSVAGARAGTDDERWLWPHIRQILGDVQPRGAFFENVPGLFRGGLGPILSDLAALGFDAEWITVRAADVSAPHKRERVFILANNDQHRRRGQGLHVPIGRPQQAIPNADRTGSELAHSDNRLGDGPIKEVRAGGSPSVDDSNQLAYSSRVGGKKGPHRQTERGRGGRVRLSSKQLAHTGHDARRSEQEQQHTLETTGVGQSSTEHDVGDARGERLQGSDDHTGAPGGVQQEPGERRSGLADADDSGDSAPRRGDHGHRTQEVSGRQEQPLAESGGSGEHLGNASVEGRQGKNRIRQPKRFTEGRSELADPDGAGLRESDDPAEGRSSEQPDSGGGELADSSSPGLQRGLLGRGTNEERRKESDGRAAAGNESLVDTISQRGRGWHTGGEYAEHAFPPGPRSPEWQRIVEERPDLAPAKSEVRGVDDGLARGMDLSRTDKLKILGNGVVPQQAALAFTILAERLAE